MTRRTLIAVLLAAAASAAFASPVLAAPGDLPTLAGNSATDAVPDWFDDHSVGGDNHLSWSNAGGDLYENDDGEASQREPHDIEWESSLTVGGPGGLEVCGYPAGVTGWMRAYQIAPGDMTDRSCPATQPASGQFGWFRYVWGRHPERLNRWHLMDLERSVLVPMAPGVPVVWDNHWGTCLNLLANGTLNCEADIDAPCLDVGVGSGTKITSTDEVDAQTIPLTNPSDAPPTYLPDGQYQIVTLTNPYGIIKENGGGIGSVRCVAVNLTIPRSGLTFGEPTLTMANPDPAECQVPATLDPMLTGPGGVDPMTGAESVPGCIIPMGNSHCWAIAPTTGDFINAHSQATGNPQVVPTIEVDQGADVPEAISATGRRPPPGGAGTAPSPSPTATPMPAPSAASTQPSTATRSAMTTAKSHTRSALRKVFGTGLSRLQVACRLRPASAATCTVSWRKSGARYSGRLYLRSKRVRGHIRWQYRVDVTKRKNGRTTHVRRDYRTGGTVAHEHA